MTLCIVAFATLLAAVGVGIPAASTQAPIVRARLELRAPSSCTRPSDLIARVVARSPHIQFVEDAAAVGVRATFSVARGVSAELVLVESAVDRTQRRFTTRTCAEAADAVALMIAVALDPVWVKEHRTVADSAYEAEGSPIRTFEATPASQGPSSSRIGPENPITKEVRRPLPPPQVSLPVRTAADSTSAPESRAQPFAGVYLAGQTMWGPAPAVMPGVAVYAIAALDHDTLWSPAIAVGAIHAWRSDLVEPGGNASFSLDAATIDMCALRARAFIVDGRACAAALIGRMSASGSDTLAPAMVAKLFAAAGAAAILTVDLGSKVELSARIATEITLRRDSYEFATTVFHTASRFTTSVSVGIGLRLW